MFLECLLLLFKAPQPYAHYDSDNVLDKVV